MSFSQKLKNSGSNRQMMGFEEKKRNHGFLFLQRTTVFPKKENQSLSRHPLPWTPFSLHLLRQGCGRRLRPQGLYVQLSLQREGSWGWESCSLLPMGPPGVSSRGSLESASCHRRPGVWLVVPGGPCLGLGTSLGPPFPARTGPGGCEVRSPVRSGVLPAQIHGTRLTQCLTVPGVLQVESTNSPER